MNIFPDNKWYILIDINSSKKKIFNNKLLYNHKDILLYKKYKILHRGVSYNSHGERRYFIGSFNSPTDCKIFLMQDRRDVLQSRVDAEFEGAYRYMRHRNPLYCESLFKSTKGELKKIEERLNKISIKHPQYFI